MDIFIIIQENIVIRKLVQYVDWNKFARGKPCVKQSVHEICVAIN